MRKIFWTQIITDSVPPDSVVVLGNISSSLNTVYTEQLYISGLPFESYLQNESNDINPFTASIKEALEFTGSNVTVKGNLMVKGTTTTINSNTVSIGDNIIELNGTGSLFGGIYVKDPTFPNRVSGSLLWDTVNDKWIAGPKDNEDTIVLLNTLNNATQSLSDQILSSSIWFKTGSVQATTNNLQITGSLLIKGDLIVEGKTLLKPTSNIEALIISGAMTIVKQEINNQITSASLTIQNLGKLSDINDNPIIDCGVFP